VDFNLNIPIMGISKSDWYNQFTRARQLAAICDRNTRFSYKEKHDEKLTSKPIETGDTVLINNRLQHGETKKLAQLYSGPYKVLEVEKGTAKLQNVHNEKDVIIRNASNLVEFKQGEDEDTRDHVFEVEKIVEESRFEGKPYYRIRWKAQDESHDSWRFAHELEFAKEVLQEWQEGKKKKKDTKEIETRNEKEIDDQPKEIKEKIPVKPVKEQKEKSKETRKKRNDGKIEIEKIIDHEKTRNGFKYVCEFQRDGHMIKETLYAGKIRNEELINDYHREKKIPRTSANSKLGGVSKTGKYFSNFDFTEQFDT
jgi:hypothetical protein